MAPESSSANGAPPPAPAQPALVIRFAGQGLAQVVGVDGPDVTPHQLYLAAWLLDAMAREARQGEVMRSMGGGLTPDMARVVQDIMGGRPAAGGKRQ